MQSDRKALREAWIRVIAACIKDAWRKGSLEKVIRSRGKKEALDWMEHRLEFSKYEPSIARVIQKFANYLSLQAPELPIEDIDYLEEHEEEALEVLREAPKLIILKAAHEAGFLKPTKKATDEKEKDITRKIDEYLGGE